MHSRTTHKRNIIDITVNVINSGDALYTIFVVVLIEPHSELLYMFMSTLEKSPPPLPGSATYLLENAVHEAHRPTGSLFQQQ